MEQIPIIPEMVQYGVIGICIMLIIALVIIVRTFVMAIMQMYDKIDRLNQTISDLTTEVKMLTLRTKTMKRAMHQAQSGIING